MNLLSESLTIGLLLTLVFGALFFYVYSRVSYVEKRVGLIENILIDIKMNQEQQPVHVLPPIPPNTSFHNVVNIPSQMEIPHVEQQQQQQQQEQELVASLDVQESQPEELYSDILEEAHATFDLSQNDLTSKTNTSKVNINYESMTKEELTEVAKQKGIRVSNRPGREKLIQLIKNTELMAVPEE